MTRRNGKLVHGIGINDADCVVKPTVNGKMVRCPYYRKWKDMLKRCYSAKEHERRPTYIGCTACEDWIYFSKFKAWMIEQDWEGKDLDKDILVPGNKIYSPETCVFIDSIVNAFTTDRGAARGVHPIGVYFQKATGKLMARCNNPFTKTQEYLGRFTDPEQAHFAWKNRKHDLAVQLADSKYVTDGRVAAALRSRYL